MREKTSQALTALAISAGATLVGRTLGQGSTLALLSEGYTFIPKRWPPLPIRRFRDPAHAY